MKQGTKKRSINLWQAADTTWRSGGHKFRWLSSQKLNGGVHLGQAIHPRGHVLSRRSEGSTIKTMSPFCELRLAWFNLYLCWRAWIYSHIQKWSRMAWTNLQWVTYSSSRSDAYESGICSNHLPTKAWPGVSAIGSSGSPVTRNKGRKFMQASISATKVDNSSYVRSWYRQPSLNKSLLTWYWLPTSRRSEERRAE